MQGLVKNKILLRLVGKMLFVFLVVLYSGEKDLLSLKIFELLVLQIPKLRNVFSDGRHPMKISI